MSRDRLFSAAPPHEALRSEPYTVDELDQLTNRARVWATILSMREVVAERESEVQDDTGGLKDRIRNEARQLRDAVAAFAAEPNQATLAEVYGVIDNLAEE